MRALENLAASHASLHPSQHASSSSVCCLSPSSHCDSQVIDGQRALQFLLIPKDVIIIDDKCDISNVAGWELKISSEDLLLEIAAGCCLSVWGNFLRPNKGTKRN